MSQPGRPFAPAALAEPAPVRESPDEAHGTDAPRDTRASGNWYAFAGVRLHPGQHRLLVDEAERPVQPLVLRLLTLLCEARGQVIPRRALFDLLWPRQEVSDESLTQVTARLRDALGPYAGCVATVRRVGLRLDAEVQCGPATPDPPPTPAPPADVPAGPTIDASHAEPDTRIAPAPMRASRRWRLPAAILLGVVLATGALLWERQRAARPLPSGYGLTEHDLASEPAETAHTIRQGLARQQEGQHQEAQVLFELAHANDAHSALPAILMALSLESEGRLREAREWRERAETRLAAQPSIRYRMLLGLAGDDKPAPTERAVASVRLAAESSGETPELSLGMAYTHLARNERREALEALRAVPLATLDSPDLAVAIADLYALGDRQAARGALERFASDLGPGEVEEVRARFAASERDWAQASAAMQRAIQASGAPPIRQLTRAALYRAQAGEFAEARQAFEALLAHTTPAPSPIVRHNLLVLLAGMPGTPHGEVRIWLEQAARNASEHDIRSACWEIELVAGLARLPADWSPACPFPEARDEAEFPGLQPLRRAYAAYRAGAADRSATALAEARQLGVGSTLFSAHASALAALLGDTKAELGPADPPSPTWSRNVAWWHFRQARAAAGSQ